jgi:hypothetical protein
MNHTSTIGLLPLWWHQCLDSEKFCPRISEPRQLLVISDKKVTRSSRFRDKKRRQQTFSLLQYSFYYRIHKTQTKAYVARLSDSQRSQGWQHDDMSVFSQWVIGFAKELTRTVPFHFRCDMLLLWAGWNRTVQRSRSSSKIKTHMNSCPVWIDFRLRERRAVRSQMATREYCRNTRRITLIVLCQRPQMRYQEPDAEEKKKMQRLDFSE